ncbi:Hint domain-containing protein [Celeribacter litoreus]|uniref:Hint domain-containing protein n=1 Tax=Celeribacter litoreus TaxID=2876714 RepID=UPI001CCAC382|nr:Hint domain-containing protein [Celeribacter litoreus]MCA0043583.1 Hint domain-containing protein [Celeribacter litoreus]
MATFDTTYWARTDGLNAKNAALNIKSDAAVELNFVADGADGDLILESSGNGTGDPDTLVEINGVLYNFEFEVSGTLPLNEGKVPDQYEGHEVYIITVYDYNGPGKDQRLYFLPNDNATEAEMNSFGNGAVAIDNATTTPTPTAICLLKGTLIRTPFGDRPIEVLKEGDLVLTASGAQKPIRYVTYQRFRTTASADRLGARPRCIPADFFGEGQPTRDLYLSINHRVALSGAEVELLFGTEQAFAPAKFLSEIEASEQETGKWIHWYNLLLDEHEIIIANGQPVESLFLGEVSSENLSARDRNEIEERFGDLTEAHIAHEKTGLPTLTKHEAQVYREATGLTGAMVSEADIAA